MGDRVVFRSAADPAVQPFAGPPGQWRLLLPAFIGWGAIAIAISRPGLAGWLGVAAALVAGVLAVCACAGHLSAGRRSSWSRAAAGAGATAFRFAGVTCAIVLVLSVRTWTMEEARAAPSLVSAAHHGEAVSLDVVLRGFPERSSSAVGDRSWVRGIAETSGSHLRSAGPVPVLLWLPEVAPEHWAPGTRVEASGRLERLEPASTAAYAVSVTSMQETAPVALAERFRGAVGALAAELRHGLRGAAEGVDGAELVPGFAVGDTSAVSELTDERMRESSLTHLTAVSGANCALITAAVVAVTSRLGAGRRVRIALAGTGLCGFVIVVGPDASVQRAAVMAVVVLVADFGGKRRAALPALGCAILVLLCADPWQARAPGFTLSVCATAGILLFVPAVERALRRTGMPRVLVLPVAVAAVAQFACGPILLTLQEGIPAVGVLANVIAAPAAPVGTGFGLLALIALPVWPAAGELALMIASAATRWVDATATVTAGLPLARWHWPGGVGGAVMLACCETAIVVAWAIRSERLPVPGEHPVARRHPWEAVRPRPRRARLAIALLTAAACGTAGAIIIVAPVADRLATPSDWSIVACDVGQGDALLLRNPSAPAEVMLVDTGDDPELLTECLRRFAVTRIATLVLTHDDRDHVGALEVAAPIADEAIIAPPTREQMDTGVREVVSDLDAADVHWSIGTAGRAGARDRQGPAWRVLAPPEGAVPAEKNTASVVMRVEAGGLSVLMLGDTGEAEHRALLRTGADLSVDVLKVAHHGSGDQDPALIAAAAADLALISVGAENTYGHPHPDVLDALDATGTRVLRTDRFGSIAVSRGSPPEVWVERGDQG
ncbi:ComEC/Rec2 family competence protein [Leucobacter sp. Psy1]|uniref:ComEC/Rec2 family competence protein n=1 Tax=Leucobacter sp. Psy1 TaxID=2875729 RepID=UPI001CD19A2C|nr:ComEC/Rec2 family competence protein [Leucobacter sp. Psy1]